MNILKYGCFGLIVGATLGAVVRSGYLFKRYVTKQEMKTDFAS